MCFGDSPYFCKQNHKRETFQLHEISTSLIPTQLLVVFAEILFSILSIKLYTSADWYF